MEPQVLMLSFLKRGKIGIVKEINGGIKIRRRLTEMGIFRGSVIRVIKNDFGGPLIVSIGEERLALGRGISFKIMVEESSE
jgi:ferrous iron transport protein A